MGRARAYAKSWRWPPTAQGTSCTRASRLLESNPDLLEYLFGRLLRAGPGELPVLRDALKPYDRQLAVRLWGEVESDAIGR